MCLMYYHLCKILKELQIICVVYEYYKHKIYGLENRYKNQDSCIS